MYNDASTSMSILLITDFLPPKFSATGQYTYHFASRYSKKKINTSLIGIGDKEEILKDKFLNIYSISAPKLIKQSSTNRLYWNLVTCLKISFLICKIRKNFKYLIFNGTPQLLIYFIFLLNFFLKKKIIFRTTDFFPETLIAFSKNKFLKFFLIKIVLFFTNKIRESFYKIQYLGYDQKIYLEKISKIDKYQIKRDICLIKFNKSPKTKRKFKIIMYSGNLGLAHDYITFVYGYKKFINNNKNRFKLWINASGQSLEPFLNLLKKEKINYFHTKTISIKKLDILLSKADIHLIFLKNEFSNIVLPSKIYCLIKSKKNILYVGPKSSDVYYLIKRQNMKNFHVNVGDYNKLSEYLKIYLDKN